MFVPKDPPWLTKTCKTLYKKYHRKFQRFTKGGYKPEEKKKVDELREKYTNLVTTEKNNYLKKLGMEVSNPRTTCKKYWTCLKRLLNKNKASIIPPILNNGVFITDIAQKCSLFNSYFQSQCTVVNTSSVLPPFVKKTTFTFDKINFSKSQITTLIRKLNTNKSHGHDGITANLLKLCDDSISTPLEIIYSNCLKKGYFPNKWKKANVIPINKKKC